MIKKAVRFLIYGILALAFIAWVAYLYIDESKPNGTKGVDAEQLADEVLKALNKEAFDSLSVIEFTFRGVNHYKWNKEEEKVKVSWEENSITLDLSKGTHDYDELQNQAYSKFINDAFWLTAPFKIRDKGVIRSTVKSDEGRGILVEYTSGGLTPGDTYLWIIDENGFPKSWKIWTSNVPIGGLEFSWENWQELDGVWFSTDHLSKIAVVNISDLKTN